MQNLDAFKRNYLVHGLNDDQVAEVFAFATEKTFSAGETVIRHGDMCGELYVILNGRANVLTPDGDKLGEVGPGNVVGEIGLIDARPSTANVVAVGLMNVAALPARELRAKMNSDRNMGFVVLANLARVLCMRLRDANQRIDTLCDQAGGGAWNNAL